MAAKEGWTLVRWMVPGRWMEEVGDLIVKVILCFGVWFSKRFKEKTVFLVEV